LIKTRQAERNKGFVSTYPLGLFSSNGCPPKAPGGLPLQEKGRNPADHISPYPDIALGHILYKLISED